MNPEGQTLPSQALIRIEGHVQGVFFRAETKKKAGQLNLTGYAKNLPDGSVIVLAQGERESLEDLIDWCHEGPPQSTVEKVEVSWETPDKIFHEFTIG